MRPLPLILVCAALLLLSSGKTDLAAAQTGPPETVGGRWQHDHNAVPCPDSPIPGKRPANTDCAVLARRWFSSLPSGPVVLRVETFPTRELAEPVAGSTSVVVEAAGKIWLLTLGSKGERSAGGRFVAEVGPIPIPPAANYEMDVSDADLGSEINSLPLQHVHPGPEIWYVLTGEQCLELPDRTIRARAGGGMFAPADTPMKLNITGPSKRDALFLVVHDPNRPWTTWTNWQPKGAC